MPLPVAGLLDRFLAPLAALRIRFFPPSDPWVRVPVKVRRTIFGDGARHHFAHYFEGESAIRVTCVDDIVRWLCECQYVSDPALFNEPDFWQHPTTFEQLRKGDCEDFAIWAWRKLVELEVDAELVIGRTLTGAESERDVLHAWLLFEQEGEAYVLDAVAHHTCIVRPLAEVREIYIPHYGVNRAFETIAFAGHLLDWRTRRSRHPGVGRAA